MQVVERHGGGSHFVRPDRVHRTGVLTSTMGYDPGADVQSVAASFTQYPMDLQVPFDPPLDPLDPGIPGDPTAPGDGMSGFGAINPFDPFDRMRPKFGAIGPIDRMRLKFRAWSAKRKARQLRGLYGMGRFELGRQLGPFRWQGRGDSEIIAQEGDEQHQPRVYDPRHMPGGAYPQIGERYLPQEIMKSQLITALMNSELPNAYARAAAGTSLRRWTNLWWNT